MLLLKRRKSKKTTSIGHRKSSKSMIHSLVYLPFLLIGIGIDTVIAMITESIRGWVLTCISLVILLFFGWHFSLGDILHDGEVLGGCLAIGLSIVAILRNGVGGGTHSRVETQTGKRNHTQEEEVQ